MTIYIKKLASIAIISAFTFKVFAPSNESLIILKTQPVEPFQILIHAVGKVETSFDTMAYNPVEEAVGYFQIRPIRLEDYNKRTGNHFSREDLYNYKISERIFLYYASEIGPYDFEKIAKNWNGSGKRTIEYWKQVREHL
jgi:hypothetical protein